MSEDLKHSGVIGMRWGHRKKDSDGVSRSTRNMAKKDAKRFVDAKMFYGETAGTKRKLLKAELDKKKKKLDGYEKVLNEEIAKVDTQRAAERAVRKRVTIDTVDKGRRLAKNILNVTGPLSVAVASALYYRNKNQVDNFVSNQLNNLIWEIKKFTNR